MNPMKKILTVVLLLFNIKSLKSQNGVDQSEFHYKIKKSAQTIENGKQADGQWKDIDASVTVDILKQNISISGQYKQIFHWYNFHSEDDSIYTRTFFACKDQDGVMVIVSVIQKLVNGESQFNLIVHYEDNQRFYLMNEYEQKR